MKFELSWALAVMLLHGNITERLGILCLCVCCVLPMKSSCPQESDVSCRWWSLVGTCSSLEGLSDPLQMFWIHVY